MNTHQILERNKNALLALDGVVAVGTGYKVSGGQTTDTIAIIVTVEKKQSPLVLKASEIIPKSLDGVPTDIVQGGAMKIFENTSRMRPAPGGVSIGHKDITAGTFGCVVMHKGRRVILSNNHVLANSNLAKLGDPILQPGPHDGGTLEDQIATLEAFQEIIMSDDTAPPPEVPSECPVGNAIVGYFNTTAALMGRKVRLKAFVEKPLSGSENLIDAAIALPLDDADIDTRILEIGVPVAIANADLDMLLQKSGRTTGYTTDKVLQVDVTVDVQYGEGKVARFADQIMAGPMSAGGDSGSAVLNGDAALVGLLFAGSEEFTIINRIQNVFSILGVTLQ